MFDCPASPLLPNGVFSVSPTSHLPFVVTQLPPPGRLPPDLARARTKSLLAALAGKLETARISSSSSPSVTGSNSPSSIAASPSQLSSLVSPSAAGSPLRRIVSDKDVTTTAVPATPSILDPDSKCSGYFMETVKPSSFFPLSRPMLCYP
jgi:hypothetical protein